MRLSRILGFAALLAAGLSAAVAPAAVVRSGGLAYVTKSSAIRPGEVKTFKAPCPNNRHVFGGGHYNTGGFGDVIGSHSYPYDNDDRGKKPDDGWAAQLSGFSERSLTSVYAICSRIRPQYVRETYTTAAGEAEIASEIDCEPQAPFILAGGTTGHPKAWEVINLQRTSGAPDFWWGGIRNTTGKERSGKAIAICTNLTVEHAFTTFNVSPLTQNSGHLSCPGGAPHIAGGGYDADTLSTTAVAATRPDGLGSTNGWQTWADNYQGTGEVQVSLAVSCVAAH